MKKIVAYGLLAVTLCAMGEGCSPQWRKKLIRPRKNVVIQQPVLVFQSEEQAIHPPDVRYREHFAYWKSWHSELLASLGKIRKRDLAYLAGTIGELRSMREVLTGPPGERMGEILEELNRLQGSWSKTPEPWYVPAAARARLDQLQREIDKKLHYSKVKQWIPPGKPSSPKP